MFWININTIPIPNSTADNTKKKKVKDILKELSISDLKIKDFYRLKIGE